MTALTVYDGFSREQIDIIKSTIAKDATDNELAFFLQLARSKNLDPFSRQIALIKRWDSKAKRDVATPQVTIDGLRLIADRTGEYVPGREPTFVHDEQGNLVSATAYVKKWRHNDWHEVPATAFWDEYVQTYTKDGQQHLTPLWARMPRLMLAKCAESLALRRAFPAELSGLYTGEELASGPQQPSAIVDVETGELPALPASAPVVVAQEAIQPAIDTNTGEMIEEKPATVVQPAGKSRPQNADEAERRFFAKYGQAVGGKAWADVQRFLGHEQPKPITIDGWISAATAVQKQEAESISEAV